jgi:signal peptide peptidase SppA
MKFDGGRPMNKYQHIRTEFYGKPWAILPEKLHQITQLLQYAAAGNKFTEEEVRERIGAGPRVTPKTPGMVALIPIYGVISQRMNMMNDISGSGGTSIEKLTAAYRAALNDPNVKAIVFDVDSPGGAIDGVPELADEIYSARGQKKTVAVANTMAASAGYWLASACDELVVTPSGAVGSIGVWGAHEDYSKALEKEGVKVTLISAGKYKVEGNPYEPLSEEARSALQADVDNFYVMFVKAVAKNRKVDQTVVANGYGQGRMVMASLAAKQGMVDGVATLDQTLARFGVSSSTKKMTASVANDLRERELALY